ncbi:aldolase [Paenibacillus sp. LHD-117]|uniref:aldolase n=1 Tax=Paenibacillus sp. LHD-117 TaxID=3071412 RepID=UPI0027DF26BA|nr:aldolase [Paenibacillus sp. LHD-117]MDQ6418877.1 aldolase [Paenibacillus sp. LHD-117]
MFEKNDRYLYKAFGFHIASDIPFPGSKPAEERAGMVDVVIEWGDEAALWESLSTPEEAFVVQDNTVLFRIANTAIYMVEAGRRVVVTPEEGAELERIRLFLDGYCMAILLLQRRILPLHGSAIALDGLAYAIVGFSGAGKSTMAKALLNQGFTFISDDIIPVVLHGTEKEAATVWPALPEQKLWQESLSEMGMGVEEYRTVYERQARSGESATGLRTKYAIPVTRFTHQALPLAGIFELVKKEGDDALSLAPIQGAERLRTLAHHTFHRSLIEPMGLMEWHFRTTSSLANRTEMLKLSRPADLYSAPGLVRLVLDALASEKENAS